MNVRDTQIIDLDWGGKVVFVNCIVGGAIDARFLPAILKGIMARMEQGPLTGSYARDTGSSAPDIRSAIYHYSRFSISMYEDGTHLDRKRLSASIPWTARLPMSGLPRAYVSRFPSSSRRQPHSPA